MRKIIPFVFALVVLVMTSTVYAEDDYRPIPISQAIGSQGIATGTWYDLDGKAYLNINNGAINGANIVSVDYTGDTVAFYIFHFNDGEDINIFNFGSVDPAHNMIVVDDKKLLRQTPQPEYYESIGGIYLGMPKSKVMEIYGEPLGVENQPLQKISSWVYSGFEIFFQYDVVTSITIYSSGDRRLDLSGLSASSSQADFERKYEKTFNTRGNLDIGRGEVITLRDGKATLQILTPGFVL